MAWLEDYDPTPSTAYEMELEPGPPSLSRAVALLAFFLAFAATVWWMATALHASLPEVQEPIMVQVSPTEATVAPTEAEEAGEDVPLPPQVEKEKETLAARKEPPAPDKLTPPTVESTLSEADRHFLRAAQLYDAKDFKASAEVLRQGLALKPDNAAQRAMLAMVLSYQGAWGESTEEYRKVLKQHPDDALLHLGLAVALHRQEKFGEAVASLKQALELDPKLDEAQRMLELLTREPEGRLEKVWFEHNVLVKGWDGFWIHTACTANYWDGRQGILRALFFYDDGRTVAGSFSNLVLANGQAAIEGPFKPPHRKTRYKDLHLFFPYKGLRLDEGEHLIKVQVELVGPTGRVLATRWSSLRLEVLKTAFGGAVEEAHSSSPPTTSTQ